MAFLTRQCGVLVNNSVKVLTSDADYADVELYKDYPEGLLMFAYVCCVICMIIGIPGNIVTLVALANYKKVRNATSIFIMNMALSDMLFLCIGPPGAMSIFTYRSWIHGRVMCELYTFAKLTLVAVSINTVTAITINRYILIIHRRLYCKIYRSQNLAIMLAMIWIAPMLALTPTYLGRWGCFGLDAEAGSCGIIPDQNNISPKLFHFISVLGVPVIPIFLCYARIYHVVRRTSKKSNNTKAGKTKVLSSNEETTRGNHPSIIVTNNNNEQKEHIPLEIIVVFNSDHSKATSETLERKIYDIEDGDIQEPTDSQKIRRGNIFKRSMTLFRLSLPTSKDRRLGTMILAIMTSFCLCYFPTTFIEILHGIISDFELNNAARILMYFSACINPIIYVVMSHEYKEAYRKLFRCRSL